MARKLTLNGARQTALRGQPDIAIQALRRFADAGDAAASASLAELLAFRGCWEEVILHAGRLIENPTSVYAGNVFNDMICLLGRAGHETGQWQQIADAAASAWEKTDRTEERVHVRNRHFRILETLKGYALRRGKAPHELIRVFGNPFSATQADRDARYKAAVYEATYNNQEISQSAAKLTAYLFAIAINSNQSEDAIKIYDAGNMPANFDYAVHLARMLVEGGNLEGGWQVLWNHMSLWWPVDKAQVAPVILLTDPKLKTLLDQDRCDQILALPRGPEAAKIASA